MFVNLSLKDIPELYSLYKSEEYKNFFRHFEDFLNIDEFSNVLNSFKWLKTEEGFVSLKIYPKPKLCLVSIIIKKEFQNQGLGFKTMFELAKYLFSNGIDRIVVNCLQSDDHTCMMCDKGGFEKEGLLVNSCEIDVLLQNEVRFGISKETFNTLYGGEYV
jgi:RimJ/RimL family protein N-acetyltransferase